MFIKGIAIFLQFILLQSANEIKAKRATLLLLGHPPSEAITKQWSREVLQSSTAWVAIVKDKNNGLNGMTPKGTNTLL